MTRPRPSEPGECDASRQSPSLPSATEAARQSPSRPAAGSSLPPTILDSPSEDRRFMSLALDEARRAGEWGEVPIGAVLTLAGEIVSARGNERERRHDPTAHAEMLVLRDAAAIAGGWRLPEATLYVTLEPCAMCAGAIVLSRIRRLVYGADDPKAGAAGSIFNIIDHPALNHRPLVHAGLMAAEASEVLREFFTARRC